MRIPKDEIQIWIDELRSGKWKQGHGFLQRGDSFCCLGVACKVFIPEDFQTMDDNNDDEIFGDMPSDQEFAPQWLQNINDDFIDKTCGQLTTLNDRDGFTFDEIADVLQAVYIEEVLA